MNSRERSETEGFHWEILILALICAILWGSAFPVIKAVYALWKVQEVEIDFATRSLFAGVRFTIAGLLLMISSKSYWRQLRATPWAPVAGFAMMQTVGQYTFFYFALSVSSGSLASILTSTGSFWWMILAPIALGLDRPGLKQWAVLMIGAIGVGVAVYAPGTGAGRPVLGAGLLITANLCSTLGLILFSKIGRTMTSRAGTGTGLFIGGVVFLFLGFPAWEKAGQLFSLPVCGVTLWLVFVSGAAFSLWNYLSMRYPVHLLATYRLMIPVSAVAMSLAFIPGERAGWGLMMGGVLVIFAMMAAQRLTPRST